MSFLVSHEGIGVMRDSSQTKVPGQSYWSGLLCCCHSSHKGKKRQESNKHVISSTKTNSDDMNASMVSSRQDGYRIIVVIFSQTYERGWQRQRGHGENAHSTEGFWVKKKRHCQPWSTCLTSPSKRRLLKAWDQWHWEDNEILKESRRWGICWHLCWETQAIRQAAIWLTFLSKSFL